VAKKHYRLGLSMILLIASLILAFKAYALLQKPSWTMTTGEKAGSLTNEETMEYLEKLIAEGHYEVLPAYDEAKRIHKQRLRTRWILAIAGAVCFASSVILFVSFRKKDERL